jgi:hypothetical protein
VVNLLKYVNDRAIVADTDREINMGAVPQNERSQSGHIRCSGARWSEMPPFRL